MSGKVRCSDMRVATGLLLGGRGYLLAAESPEDLAWVVRETELLGNKAFDPGKALAVRVELLDAPGGERVDAVNGAEEGGAHV